MSKRGKQFRPRPSQHSEVAPAPAEPLSFGQWVQRSPGRPVTRAQLAEVVGMLASGGHINTPCEMCKEPGVPRQLGETVVVACRPCWMELQAEVAARPVAEEPPAEPPAEAPAAAAEAP